MTLEEWKQRYDELIKSQPKDCTRRRVKPFIDGCGCDWCERFSELLMTECQKS